mmetsp:Transcript_24826/g.36734  ORF Transcript_24826/g.36734 Transcript_24826/m.36734 type:complete len:161 (-) Transcript_24826:151-633(-)
MSPAVTTTVGLLPESLQKSLESVVERVNDCGCGIQVVLLSTSAGVSLGRIVQQPMILEEELLANLESTWAPPSKQFPLLQSGDVRIVTAHYDQLTLVHVYKFAPVVVTFLLQPNSNLGAIKSTAIPLFQEKLEPLCQTLYSLLPGETTPSSSIMSGGYYQ